MGTMDELERRIERIEDHLGLSHSIPDGEQEEQPEPPEGPGESETDDEPDRTEPEPTRRDEPQGLGQLLLTWFVDRWVLSLGGLFVVLSAIWFVSSGYITFGPAGRVAVTMLVGFGFMTLGLRLQDRGEAASILLGTGSTIALSGLYMAVLVYQLIGIGAGLLFALTIIGAHAFMALLSDLRGAVAVTPFFVGLIPFAMEQAVYALPNIMGLPFELASILFLLVGSTPVVVGSLNKNWHSTLTTTILTLLFYSSFFDGATGITGWLVLIVTLSALEGAFAGLAYRDDTETNYHYANGLLIAFGAFLWPALMYSVGVSVATPMPVIYAMLLFGAAFGLVGLGISDESPKAAATAYLQTMIMAIAATGLYFEGHGLSAAFAIEATFAFVVMLIAEYERSSLVPLGVLSAIVLQYITQPFVVYEQTPEAGVVGVLGLLFVSGLFSLLSFLFAPRDKGALSYILRLAPAGIVYLTGGAFVWAGASYLTADPILARGIALTVYVFAGIALIGQPLPSRETWQTRLGQLTLGLVAFRLLTVEAWIMPTPYRIVTFLTIGLLLVGYALYQRL